MISCPICQTEIEDRLLVLKHIRDVHTTSVNIRCCNINYTFGSYTKHLRQHHDIPRVAVQHAAIEQQDHGAFEGAFNEPLAEPDRGNDSEDEDQDFIGIFVPPTVEQPPQQDLSPRETFQKGAESFRDKCFEKWLQLSSHPDATEKSAGICCDLLLETAVDVVNLCKSFLIDGTDATILSTLKNILLPMTSDYRRKQYLDGLGYFVQPKPYVIDYEHINVRTDEGVHTAQRRQTVAMPSIRESLLSVLNNTELANELVMPSDYRNAETWDHPFCGTRVQRKLADLGEDFLALQLFMDEFTTTCPIASKSKTYKMVGCYIRLLNFPVDLLSKLDHIFLCFIGHATEIMGQLQLQLSKTVIVELQKLEEDGITLNYRGTNRHLKVILLTLAADNLGIHQLGGLILSFASHNPCRMCTVTAESLKGVSTLDPAQLKTAARYDELVATNDPEQMWIYGIKSMCAFNSLANFHIMDNTTVDIMHDLLEGHFQKLVPLVLRDAIAHGYTLATINNAIKAFQFYGPDAQNPPNPIALPANAPETGDSIKMSANEMSTLVKLLPLIFHFGGIRLNSPTWLMFMKMQRIIDILWAHCIDAATTAMLDQHIQNYLAEFHANGGNMTIKAHLLLHYPQVINEMGPLRYLSSMRFEAKHRSFKQHAKVSRCTKNVPHTLASKSATIFAYNLYLMRKGNYLASLRASRAQGKYKRGLAVVYGQNPQTKEPLFGEIRCLTDTNLLQLHCLSIVEFDPGTHCFVIEGTSQTIQVAVVSLKLPDPVPIYAVGRRYIRLREHLI